MSSDPFVHPGSEDVLPGHVHVQLHTVANSAPLRWRGCLQWNCSADATTSLQVCWAKGCVSNAEVADTPKDRLVSRKGDGTALEIACSGEAATVPGVLGISFETSLVGIVCGGAASCGASSGMEALLVADWNTLEKVLPICWSTPVAGGEPNSIPLSALTVEGQAIGCGFFAAGGLGGPKAAEMMQTKRSYRRVMEVDSNGTQFACFGAGGGWAGAAETGIDKMSAGIAMLRNCRSLRRHTIVRDIRVLVSDAVPEWVSTFGSIACVSDELVVVDAALLRSASLQPSSVAAGVRSSMRILAPVVQTWLVGGPEELPHLTGAAKATWLAAARVLVALALVEEGAARPQEVMDAARLELEALRSEEEDGGDVGQPPLEKLARRVAAVLLLQLDSSLTSPSATFERVAHALRSNESTDGFLSAVLPSIDTSALSPARVSITCVAPTLKQAPEQVARVLITVTHRNTHADGSRFTGKLPVSVVVLEELTAVSGVGRAAESSRDADTGVLHVLAVCNQLLVLRGESDVESREISFLLKLTGEAAASIDPAKLIVVAMPVLGYPGDVAVEMSWEEAVDREAAVRASLRHTLRMLSRNPVSPPLANDTLWQVSASILSSAKGVDVSMAAKVLASWPLVSSWPEGRAVCGSLAAEVLQWVKTLASAVDASDEILDNIFTAADAISDRPSDVTSQLTQKCLDDIAAAASFVHPQQSGAPPRGGRRGRLYSRSLAVANWHGKRPHTDADENFSYTELVKELVEASRGNAGKPGRPQQSSRRMKLMVAPAAAATSTTPVADWLRGSVRVLPPTWTSVVSDCIQRGVVVLSSEDRAAISEMTSNRSAV